MESEQKKLTPHYWDKLSPCKEILNYANDEKFHCGSKNGKRNGDLVSNLLRHGPEECPRN